MIEKKEEPPGDLLAAIQTLNQQEQDFAITLPLLNANGLGEQIVQVTVPRDLVLIIDEPYPGTPDYYVRRMPPRGKFMTLGDLTEVGVSQAARAQVVLVRRHNGSYMLVKNDFGPAPRLLPKGAVPSLDVFFKLPVT